MSRTIFTFSQLSDKLDSELSWRRKELQLLTDLIKPNFSPLQTSLLRAAVPILYSHWEGFVKVVTESYLEFISNKYIKTSELKTTFIVLSLLKKIDNYEINDFHLKVKFIDTFINEFNKSANVPVKNVVQTKSNLWYENFEEIVYILNLNIMHFKSYESVVDDLVNSRNFIAHGHFLRIDYNSFFSIYGDIIKLLIQLKTEIENSSITEQYKDTNKFAI